MLLQDPEYDKYTFAGGVRIDCENRVHLCRAACCRLPFALSKQDIQEGTCAGISASRIMIAQEEDGYCTHLDRSCHRCTVTSIGRFRAAATTAGRTRRIWLDFENKTINPDILRR